MKKSVSTIYRAVARRKDNVKLLGKLVGWSIGVLIAGSTLKSQLDQRRVEFAQQQFLGVMSNIGSESPVTKGSAIRQIGRVIRTRLPAESAGSWGDGLGFLFGQRKESASPFHETLLEAIRGLARADLDREPTSALLGLLCEMGAEGWYQGQAREPTQRARCLQWVWENTLHPRLTDGPSYTLFEAATIRDFSLDQMYLQRANFGRGQISEGDFSYSDLEAASFRAAVVSQVSFINANLEGADFRNATLREVSFVSADLSGADFSGAIFLDVEFADANLHATKMPPSILLTRP